MSHITYIRYEFGIESYALLISLFDQFKPTKRYISTKTHHNTVLRIDSSQLSQLIDFNQMGTK